MPTKIPKKCPSCDFNLEITRLTCPNCGTEITGHYQPDLFSRLPSNDFDFIVLFVKTRGNIREMERELGISYWTIRSRLNEIVVQLGFESEPVTVSQSTKTEDSRQIILQQLNDGVLSFEEAEAKLRDLKTRSKKGEPVNNPKGETHV
jgi:hypothetical protein